MEKKERKFKGGGNTAIMILAISGIVVLINVLALRIFGQIDLTENNVYALSDVSKEAVRSLEDLEVRVYISKDLPDTISVGWARNRSLKGVPREFTDKLRQYQSFSNGNMRIVFVSDNIEENAEKSKLQLFTGKEAAVEKGRLAFKKYALGATFHYKNQMEVLPLAIETEHYEFEITKILLRLKEKYEKSLLIKDLLEAGKDIYNGAKECKEKIESLKPEKAKEEEGLGALFKSKEEAKSEISLMKNKLNEIKEKCVPVEEKVKSAKKYKGKNDNLDILIADGEEFVDYINELIDGLESSKDKDRKLLSLKEKISDIFDSIDNDHSVLENAPGRKTIGFLCGHGEFCPFIDPEPLIRPEIAGLLGQKNPFVSQFVQQAKQIEDNINMINSQLERGLFTTRGISVRRIEPEGPVPDDVSALVVFGPEKPLSDRTLYEIDQFLLSGKSVLFFINNWSPKVYNLRMGEDFQSEEFDLVSLDSNSSNIDKLLEHYGIKVKKNLIMEKRNFEPITIIQIQRKGQFSIQTQRDFPFPLLPTFSDFPSNHILVRNLPNISLPYVSSLELSKDLEKNKDIEALELIKSSSDSIAKEKDIEIDPVKLYPLIEKEISNGPHTLAVSLKGKFTSYFKGKEIPKREKKEEREEERASKPDEKEKPFREEGKGRLLVIGSNFGLENLSAKKIFEGFEMSQLASGQADFFLKLRDYIANFQNWQLRISQIGHVIQSNLEFIYNCFDWAIQKEALVEIRSKGVRLRPIKTLSKGEEGLIRYGSIIGIPVLFIFIGLVRFILRQKKAGMSNF